MKKILIGLLALIVAPLSVLGANAEKVKVYLFEAGGCPYCEMELEYLEGLDSYNKTFEIVKKELYVDHNDWAPGDDFITGVKTALAFNDAGFSDAAYTGTPFVVISDLYAAASYSTELEKVIDEAYDKGDKDVVGCIAKGKDKCLDGYKDSQYEEKANTALEETLTSQIARCVKTNSGNCTALYEDTSYLKLAEDINDIVADVYSCMQDGGSSECAEDYEDADERKIAENSYSYLSQVSSSTEGQNTATNYSTKNVSPVAVVIVLLSFVIVFGLIFIGAKKLNSNK